MIRFVTWGALHAIVRTVLILDWKYCIYFPLKITCSLRSFFRYQIYTSSHCRALHRVSSLIAVMWADSSKPFLGPWWLLWDLGFPNRQRNLWRLTQLMDLEVEEVKNKCCVLNFLCNSLWFKFRNWVIKCVRISQFWVWHYKVNEPVLSW